MRKLLTGSKSMLFTIVATAMVLAIATTAGAVSGDRNGDGIPDSWAKRHGLKASKNQANRDQDRDHVRNICEYEAGLDPRDRNSDNDRKSDAREDSDDDGMVNSVESEVQSGCDDADSDDDGQDDGDEISGYVHSLTDEVLKLRMVDGTILTAPVTDETYVYCERDEFVQKPEPEPADKPPVDDDDADDATAGKVRTAQGDGGSYDDGNCGLAALTPGRIVKAFYVEDGFFVKLKLLD